MIAFCLIAKSCDDPGAVLAEAGLAICAADCLLQYVNDTLKTEVRHL